MSDTHRRPPAQPPMGETVEANVKRRLTARASRRRSVWFGLGMFGLGMFGMAGWSVAIPTVAGIALGIWNDSPWPGRISWTLTLLFLGLGLGCLDAWRWVSKENGGE